MTSSFRAPCYIEFVHYPDNYGNTEISETFHSRKVESVFLNRCLSQAVVEHSVYVVSKTCASSPCRVVGDIFKMMVISFVMDLLGKQVIVLFD